jgi:GntR family transcriptional regulator/MocR family aminotransferase
MVVAGAQQAIDLAARVLIDPHDPVWIEDPAYLGARHALLGAGARLMPIPVDAEGLDVEAGKRLKPTARLVYITPSYQYPTGTVMSLARRLKLLQWASQVGAWILEDDYDGEYRYTGHPLAALQGLDQAGRVVYIGTFSKVLFPALRLGYMVVPTDLIEAFTAALALSNRGMATFEQAVVTDFMTEGHFARHIRRMRTLYAERQAVLVEAIQRELAGYLTVQAAEAGMHIVGWLPPQTTDHDISRQLGQAGLDAPPLSAYALQYSPPSGLALGYTSFRPEAIRAGVIKLARCLVS